MTICDAVKASVIATGATISSTNLYSSPVVIVVAAYVALCLLGCVLVVMMSRRALDFRMVPLERLSKLPNSVLQRLESAAASSVAAAERAVEGSVAAPGDDGAESQNDEDATDWRYAPLTLTSKDMQKGTSKRPRERIIFSCVLMAPLLLSSIIFILLVNAIWMGTQTAGVSSNALTNAMLTEVAERQAVYYSLVGATLSDADGNATLAAAAAAHADANARVDAMFFGDAGDVSSDAALESVHFGDLCAPGVLPLSTFESGRCGNLGGHAPRLRDPVLRDERIEHAAEHGDVRGCLILEPRDITGERLGGHERARWRRHCGLAPPQARLAEHRRRMRIVLRRLRPRRRDGPARGAGAATQRQRPAVPRAPRSARDRTPRTRWRPPAGAA